MPKRQYREKKIRWRERERGYEKRETEKEREGTKMHYRFPSLSIIFASEYIGIIGI